MSVIGYRVELAPRAIKDIKKLSANDRERVVKALDALAVIPRPPGCEKLKENPAFFRIKAGADFRIIYTVDDPLRLIVVAVVRDRKDAYRNLAALDAKDLIAAIQPLLVPQHLTSPSSQ